MQSILIFKIKKCIKVYVENNSMYLWLIIFFKPIFKVVLYILKKKVKIFCMFFFIILITRFSTFEVQPQGTSESGRHSTHQLAVAKYC